MGKEKRVSRNKKRFKELSISFAPPDNYRDLYDGTY